MTENQQYRKPQTELDDFKDSEIEIDLLEIFRKIIGVRKTLCKAAGIGFIIGVIVSLSISKQYTVKVTLSPEMGVSKGNSGIAGLAASFLGNDVTGGNVSDALNASLAAEIVSSTPFLLELLKKNVPDSNNVMKITLETYLDEQSISWWDYVLGFPGIIVNWVRSLFVDEETNNGIKLNVIQLTKEEARRIAFLKKNITASMDKKTAITEILVTLQDPKVAAIVANFVVYQLQDYIINYRTSKAKEDCIYLEKLYKDRRLEYYVAQKKYADYVDTHDNLILQSVRSEQERLQNDMALAYQIYSQVANQLQVARAKVQEEKPVFAIVEPAVVPLKSSNLGMKIYVLLFVFLAVISAIGWTFWGKGFWSSFRNE